MGLLISRLTVVDQVAEFKKRNNMDALQPARFNQMLERLHKRGAEIGVPKELIDEVWSAIHRQSLERENGRLSKDD
jgi:chorismate mutase